MKELPISIISLLYDTRIATYVHVYL